MKKVAASSIPTTTFEHAASDSDAGNSTVSPTGHIVRDSAWDFCEARRGERTRQRTSLWNNAKHTVAQAMKLPSKPGAMEGYLTQQADKVLTSIIYQDLAKCGEQPPCKFALVASGSYASQQMSSHSDIDFYVIVDNSTRPLQDHSWFHFAAIRWRDKMRKHDFGGALVLCPMYAPSGNAECIATAKAAADNSLYTLFNSRLIEFEYNDPKVYADFEKQRQKNLCDPKARQFLLDLYTKRGMMRRHKWRDLPSMEVVDVKALRREFDFLIAHMALKNNVVASGTYNRIAALRDRGLLSAERASALSTSVDEIGRLRISAQLQYNKEFDLIDTVGNRRNLFNMPIATLVKLPKIRDQIMELYDDAWTAGSSVDAR